jgi:phage tail sheath protein FI
MSFSIGVNVLEVDGRAAPTIVGAPISVTGFLVRSPRGIPNLPVAVRGYGDYVRGFDSFTETSYGAFALRGFFDNGGMDAYVVRVLGSGASAASATLTDSTAAQTLRVTAGRRGLEDPGDWGNSLSVGVVDQPRGSSAVPAHVVGTAQEPFALADGETLQVTVNGAVAPVTVTLPALDFAVVGAASAGEVAAAINRRTTAFRAAATANGHVLLASAVPGPRSRLAVAGTAAAALGFAGPTATTDAGLETGATLAPVASVGGFAPHSAVRLETPGLVVAPNALAVGLTDGAAISVTADGGAPVTIVFTDADFDNGSAAITPEEVVRTINRQAQGFSAALTAADRLMLQSDTYGPASTVAIAAPGGGAPDATAALGLTGAVAAPGRREFRELATVSEGSGLATWTAGLPAPLPANAVRIQSVEFDLVVARNGVEVERFASLSMQNQLDWFAESVVNDQAGGSSFVTVSDRNSGAGAGRDAPAAPAPVPLALGSDGSAPTDASYVGDPAFRTGLHAFDTVAIQLLACPETTSPGVVAAALAYCEQRGDAMFVGSVPPGLDREGWKDYARPFRARKVFGALYAPWIEIANPLDTTGANPRRLVPPTGHVLGTYARIGEARGVWKAPAGDEARLEPVLGVELEMTDVDHTDLVRNGGVNGIRALPGSGIVIDASRTLSTDTRWLYVNVRRLFNFVKVSLRDGLRFVPQEPHDEELRRKVRFNVVEPFLLGLWKQGAFGSDPAEQVFTVKCDASNNPPAEVNLGRFRIEVYFYPVKPAETIVVVVGQQESGGTATDG